MLNHDNMHAVVEAALDKSVPLTAALLVTVADAGTSSMEIITMLCIYINNFKQIERDADLKALCDMSVEINMLRDELDVERKHRQEAVDRLMNLRMAEADALHQKANLELEIADLRCENHNLKGRLQALQLAR